MILLPKGIVICIPLLNHEIVVVLLSLHCFLHRISQSLRNEKTFSDIFKSLTIECIAEVQILGNHLIITLSHVLKIS